ncbi:protein IWS1 homolog A-like isoform X1 [Bolinopsis microptera]|uniref:protein IWS1 homolog A-like isoform X1 n=1 Tax=Bolinopsis microptera TaxID=2820187 RepID=UPI003078C407
MSKRRNLKKPSYVISDSEDDEDFVLPAAKRTKSSQDKTRNIRSNVGDRALEREVERAKQLSLNENKAGGDKTCTATGSNKENSNKRKSKQSNSGGAVIKRQSKAIIISSQSGSDASQPTPNINAIKKVSPRKGSRNEGKTKVAAVKPLGSDSDEEFSIATPESSEPSSSESDFKISQISEEEKEERTSDEEFKLSSEDEFTPTKEKVKPRVKQNAKSAPKTPVNANKQSAPAITASAINTPTVTSISSSSKPGEPS